MDRIEFLESFEGRKCQYWKRFTNTIIISFELDKFETKRSKKEIENYLFQNFILNELIKRKKNCFRNAVAVEFVFHVNQKNPPAIQSLLKHYIDLIQKPHKDINTKRKYLLIKDDSQIKALSSYYWNNSNLNKQKLTIIIKPFRDFIYNLKFARDIQFGKFNELESKQNSYKKELQYETDRRTQNLDFSISENNYYAKLATDKSDIEFHNLYAKILREQENQELLKLYSNLSADSILNLITESETINNEKSKFDISLDKIGRAMVLEGLYFMNFGSVPISEGESALFKERIKAEIEKWRIQRGYYLPNSPAISVKLFYEKPDKVTHDLDNLLRYVIPHFDSIINKGRNFKSVTSIEIYQINTVSENKKSGNLYLRIEELGDNNMFHITGDLLNRYEE